MTPAALEQQAVMLREFTPAKTPSVLSMDPGSDVEMVTRKVQAPVWLSEICVELFREIGDLGDCIKEIMRTKQDPRLITPDLVHAYELALAHQADLYCLEIIQLHDTQRHDFLRVKAASKQFTAEVQMAIQFVNLSAEQRAMEIGRELLGRINMQAAVNASQMERINNWLLASQAAYSESSLP